VRKKKTYNYLLRDGVTDIENYWTFLSTFSLESWKESAISSFPWRWFLICSQSRDLILHWGLYIYTYWHVCINGRILYFRYKCMVLFFSSTVFLTFPFSSFLSSGKIYGRDLAAQTYENIILGLVGALH